jgi:hypothetical protein
MAKQRLSSADQLVMYKIVISYCVRLCAILNLQFLLVFTAMLMLCYLLWFKEINELIRLTICQFAQGGYFQTVCLVPCSVSVFIQYSI